MQVVVLTCLLIASVIAISHAHPSSPVAESVHPVASAAAAATSSGSLHDSFGSTGEHDSHTDTAHLEDDSDASVREKRLIKIKIGGGESIKAI